MKQDTPMNTWLCVYMYTSSNHFVEPMQAEEDPKRLERLSTKELFLKNMDYALDMFLIYALTLSIFPGFLSEDTGSHSLGAWLVFQCRLLLFFF